MAPRLDLAQLEHELEAIHDRHHEIEHDQVGHVLPEALESRLPVLGLRDDPSLLRERPAHQLPYLRVVFHEQSVARWVLATILAENPRKLRAVHGLRQVVGRAERVPHALVIDHGEHDDGGVAQLRIALQLSQHGPAVRARHYHVERDRRGSQLPGQAQPLVAA